MGNFLVLRVTGGTIQILVNRAFVLLQVNKEREPNSFRIDFFQSSVPMAV